MSALARWQGEVDATLRDHGRRLDDVDGPGGLLDRILQRVGGLEVGQGRLMVGIGVAGAIGSILGGGIVTAIVYLVAG